MAEIPEVVKVRKTYKYKLYKTKKTKHLLRIILTCAEIYNHCIALHKRYHRLYGQHLNKYKLQKHLTKLKKLPKYSHWKKVPSQSIQDITDRIQFAYERFFDYLKKKEKGLKPAKVSPPTFKKASKYKSFTLKQAGWKLEENAIYINGKKYKFWLSRPISGIIKTVTIKRDNVGDFFVCFSVIMPVRKSPVSTASGKIVGADFGLRTFITLSDGTKIEFPQYLLKHLNELRKLNKSLSKKEKGSRHWLEAKKQLAKLHRKIADTRRDFFHKLANTLAEKYDWIAVEDLNIKAMQRRWGRKVSDLAYSEFTDILKQKTNVIEIDRFFPRSKTCSLCGYINKSLSLKDREWICPKCGTKHDRDLNASVNICRVGASTLGIGSVRPSHPISTSCRAASALKPESLAFRHGE